jgi:hypothetical protein
MRLHFTIGLGAWIGLYASGYGRAGLDLSPASDDRPFFFQAQRLFRSASPELQRAADSDINLASVSLLRSTLALLSALALALFFAPLALFGRPTRGADLWRGGVYFFSIGLGFMLLELPWMAPSCCI